MFICILGTLDALNMGQYRQTLGISIQTKRLDVFKRAVAGNFPDSLICDMLSYTFRVVKALMQSRDYRSQLLRTLLRLIM